MMTTKKILLLAILVTFFSAPVVFADTVVRTGENVSVAEDKGVVGDFYAAASIVNISGTIEGDLVAAAGRTTVNGSVSGDVLVFGGSVDIHAPVSDDVRVLGGEVVIAEPVAGDVFVIGGTVSILSTASVGGDVLVYGGEVEILGPVAGNVLGSYGSLRIDTTVGGDVQVSTNDLALGDDTVITGSVVYESQNILQRSPNAIVEKNVVRNDVAGVEGTSAPIKQYVIAVLMAAFATLIWYLFSKRSLTAITNKATVHSPRAALFGLVALIISPVVIVILFSSMLGSVVAVILLLAYLLTIVASLVAVPVVVGKIALVALNQPNGSVSLLMVAVGVLGSTLILLLPFVGPLLIILLFIVTVGAVIDLLATTHNA